ncbi:MAG: sugar phosphate isomerase/epimerase family protein, partial [Candidatus Hydrothermarchaeaceae archaeon]
MDVRVGASSLGFMNHSPEEAVRRIGEAGFDLWELIPEGSHLLEDYSGIRDILQTYNIGVAIHAPFSDLNIASSDERIRQKSIFLICGFIEVADFLGASTLTFHSGRVSRGESWETALGYNMESIAEIAKFGKKYNVELCLENGPTYAGAINTKAHELRDAMTSIDGLMGITLDVGHANTVGDVCSFIRELHPWLKNVHLHDNMGREDNHLAIGEGKINFKGIL